MNDSTFKAGIAFLSNMYGKKCDDQTVSAYWNILKKYSDENFKMMLENLTENFIPTSQVPFPLIPHFLQACGASGRARGRIAIRAIMESGQTAYGSVNFGDRALHATINHFGGWPVVARWGHIDWGYKEKAFLETYEANRLSDCGPEYLPGLTELDAATKDISTWNQIQIEDLKRQSQPSLISWSGNNLLIGNTKKPEEIEDKT